MKGTIFLAAIFAAILFGISASVGFHKLKRTIAVAPDPAKVQTYTQRTYSEGHCADNLPRFYIKPGSLTIVHHDKNGSPYATFCYTGRWAGEYFIARQNDTIAQVNLDSAMVFPRCCPIKYR
jgi:hypothetical protein